jgi:hypothetical protein
VEAESRYAIIEASMGSDIRWRSQVALGLNPFGNVISFEMLAKGPLNGKSASRQIQKLVNIVWLANTKLELDWRIGERSIEPCHFARHASVCIIVRRCCG